MDVQNTPYSAMNIHPNPYGNSLEPNVIPLPQESDKQSITPQLTQEQIQMINQQQQSFPSRDILWMKQFIKMILQLNQIIYQK